MGSQRQTPPKPRIAPEVTPRGVQPQGAEIDPADADVAPDEPIGHPFEALQIDWKDGLPKDRAEDSTIESTLVTSGLTSKYSAIKRLNDGDDKAAEEELERIKEEQNEAMMAEAAMGGGPGMNSADTQGSAGLIQSLKGSSGEKAEETGQDERGKTTTGS
jgi:hypothetical protein